MIEKSLYQTKNGNPMHFLIEGERGLGKTSLFLRVAGQALGQTQLSNGHSVHFIVLNLELDASQSFFDILKMIAADFKRAIAEREKVKSLAANTWEFLNKWEILGVRYHKMDQSLVQPYEVLNDLVVNFRKVITDTKGAVDGILILLDEADRPGEKAALGELIKLLTEKLSKQGCNQVLLGLTGQPGLIAKLKASHESSSRVFTIFDLKPLNQAECISVIKSGIEIAYKINHPASKIEDDACELIALLSEGYPHFLQEFSFKAFEADHDNLITVDDVKEGAFGPDGALSQLGHKFFNEIFYNQIGSDEYRGVLAAMAKYSDSWVNRTMIKKELEIKDTTLNNALQALKSRNIIIPNHAQSGEFKLPTKSFAAWINAHNTLHSSIK
jgi:DNA polymerase III delta prime subunit